LRIAFEVPTMYVVAVDEAAIKEIKDAASKAVDIIAVVIKDAVVTMDNKDVATSVAAVTIIKDK